jgi:hypothetical protein
MMYLCIIFVPPLYFAARRKWGGFFINACLYGMACLFLLTFVLAIVGVIFWALAFGHAMFSYRREMMATHADLIATKMAEKLRENKP